MPTTPLEDALAEIERDLQDLKRHRGSRYVGTGADREVAEHIAKGGSYDRATGELLDDRRRIAEPRGETPRTGAFAKAIVDIATHNVGHLERTPKDWLGTKALAEQTDASGGYILPVEVSTDVAAIIRANTAVLKMPGIRTLEPKSKEYDLPGLATGTSAGYLPENAAIPATTATFEIMNRAYPRALATLVSVSNWLLTEAMTDPSIESILKEDMAAAMAVAQDTALLFGSNASAQPKGITTYSGLTAGPNLGANGSPPSYNLLTQIPAALRTQNAPFKNPGWIVSPKLINLLLTLTDSIGRPLFADNPSLLSLDPSGMSGRLLGFPFVSTNTMPSNQTIGSNNNGTTVIFGSDWNEAYYLEWEGMSMASSSEAAYTPDGLTWISAFQSYQTLFRPIMRHDLQLRRPNFWVVSGGWLV
ncbi:MAG TPA: phage major capsid protein [Solirubrobacteraceae bacterium]|nr:phage major capsid protein [Solirubrobacteraceae bacterium]